VNSHLAEPFFRHWHGLPREIQTLARKNYRLWRDDSGHPSLHFKELKAGLWRARLGLHYRVLGRKRGDTIHWFWVGPHAEYDAQIRRL